MAKPHILREVEQARGEPLDIAIPALVNEGGQQHAAHVLGVSQATVSGWLKANDYVKVVRYEKKEQGT